MADPTPGSGDQRIAIADFPHRVRTSVCGIVIADTTHAKILRETGHPAVFYFPPDDVRIADFLTPTDKSTTCPYKGAASYWTFRLGDHGEDNLAWAYPDPIPACAAIRGYLAFYWDRMDCWFVDDAQIQAPPS